MPEPPLLGTNRCDPPRTATIFVFIRCRKCGTPNQFENIPVRRVDLALFRGSDHPVKCKGCHDDMDPMGAFVGERAGAEIVRRPDPER
jgi:hypothetical protein